jgi:outer membrane immunogenic protein
MKNSFMISTASAVLAVFAVGPATAADLPMRAYAPAPVAPPIFNWTGCYIGVHAGGGVMRDNFTDEHGSGGLAGGQAGCNYQDGNAVFGIEGEGYWSGLKDNFSENGPFSGFGLEAKNKYDFSIAARMGIAFDRTMIYGKAGWVWGKFDFAETSTCCGSFPGFSSTAASGTLDGLLLGVGVEHAITNNWTIKFEYNYLKYGSKELGFTNCSNSFGGPTSCFANTTGSVAADKQIFKIGANYLFNMGGAPLVAKY